MAKKLSALEKKFAAAVKTANPLIEEKLAAAERAIVEAQALAEAHGVPFAAYIDGGALKNEYVPESFETLGFDKIEDMYELGEKLEMDLPYTGEGYAGWQQSYC